MSKFTLISNKADRILGMTAAAVAATTGAGLVGNAPQASADIVYSGPVSIAIPDNIDGVYMNLLTGATGSSGGAVAGWDINPYTAAAGQFNLWAPGAPNAWWNNAGTYVAPLGQLIDGAGTYTVPGGGTNVGTQVTLNAPNYFGVQLLNESGATQHFAWVEITFGATPGERSITGYAYESTAGTGISVGAVPEPGTFAALAMGAVGLFARRRRSA